MNENNKGITSQKRARITTVGYYGGMLVFFLMVIQIPGNIILLQNIMTMINNTTDPDILNMHWTIYKLAYTDTIRYVLSLSGPLVGFLAGKLDLKKFIEHNEEMSFNNILAFILGLKYTLLWVLATIITIIIYALSISSIISIDLTYDHIFIIRLLQALPISIMLMSIVTFFYPLRKYEIKNEKIITLSFLKDQILVSTTKEM